MIFNPQISFCSVCHLSVIKASEGCLLSILQLKQHRPWEAAGQLGQGAAWVRVWGWILWPQVQAPHPPGTHSCCQPVPAASLTRDTQAEPGPRVWHVLQSTVGFQLMCTVSHVVLNIKTKRGVPFFVLSREYYIWYYLNWRVIRLTGHAEKRHQGFCCGNKTRMGRHLVFGKEQPEFLPSATLIFFTLNQNHKANPAQSRWNMETSVKRTGQGGPVTQILATGVSLLGSRTSWKVPCCSS